MNDSEIGTLSKLVDLERKVHAPSVEKWKKRTIIRYLFSSTLMLLTLGVPAIVGPNTLSLETMRIFILLGAFVSPAVGVRKPASNLKRLELLALFAVLIVVALALPEDSIDRVLASRAVWITLLAWAVVATVRRYRELSEYLLKLERIETE